jgi:hypothetical protein
MTHVYSKNLWLKEKEELLFKGVSLAVIKIDAQCGDMNGCEVAVVEKTMC